MSVIKIKLSVDDIADILHSSSVYLDVLNSDESEVLEIGLDKYSSSSAEKED